jgi:Concanavalin A-like lectin/glucanases superfamily
MQKKFKKVIVLLFTIIALPLFADENGLVAHWPMNEGKGTEIKDVSGNNNNGKIINKMRAVKWVDGRNGKAPMFEGTKKRNSSGAIIIPKMGKYDFSKGMTVEAWIKLPSKYKRETLYEIISNTKGDSGPGFRLVISWKRLLFASGDGKKLVCAATSTAKVPFKGGIWYHVAGTYDGSIFKVYVDGVKAAESKPGLKLTKGDSNISIGSYRYGYAYGFIGIISDVKLYTKVLSALDIAKAAKGL